MIYLDSPNFIGAKQPVICIRTEMWRPENVFEEMGAAFLLLIQIRSKASKFHTHYASRALQ
jgi:hypothetical protein